MRRITGLIGLAALIALGSDGALIGAAGTTGGGDRWQFRLRLFAPEPEIRRDPARPEAGPVLSIPTFDRLQPDGDRAAADGQVPRPVKVVRVAIPEGARVSLESIRAPGRTLRDLRLGPEVAPGEGNPGGDTGPTAAADVGTNHSTLAGDSPAGPAHVPVRLGQTGYLRSQRFVEIIYEPVGPPRTSTRAGSLRDGTLEADFHPEVEADLVVSGVDWTRVRENAARVPEDPHFEGTYRNAFLNYEEGRAFRVPRRGDAAATTSLSPPVPAGLSAFAGATTPVYRVTVAQPGIYRLTHAYLLAPGTGVAPGLAGADPNTFKLLNKGVEVPIRVVTAVPGTFAAGDHIEFYGDGMLDEPELILNFDFDTIGQPGQQDILQANDFTDENVYFLFAEPGTRSRIPTISGTVVGGFPQESSFAETVHREIDNRFVPNGSDDPFYQDPFLSSNNGTFSADPNAPNCGHTNTGVHTMAKFLGPGFPSGDPRHCPACDLALPDPLSVPDPATVRVRMRGSSTEPAVNPDHMTVVQVGTVAAQSSTLCWDGEVLPIQTLTLPQTALSGGAGVYIGQPGLAATVSNESLILDWIEVDYRRALKLNAGFLLATFTNVDRTYVMSGFPTGTSADQVIYDISATLPGSTVPSPRRVTGGTQGGGSGNFSVTFSLAQDGALPPGARRRLAASGSGGFRLPVRVEQVTGEDLTLTTHEADMIVVTRPDVVDMVPGSAFRNYLDHRALDSGLTIKLVMMRDIYDHFSFGLETPEALRAFLGYAFDNWKGPGGTAAPPSYTMLVGDTSLDYKNLLSRGDWINQVPTFIMYRAGPVLDYYSADTYIAAFRGADQLPDIHLGRVPVRAPADSEIVFQKLLDYDQIPPPGSWRSHGIFVADRGLNAGETAEFETKQSEVADQRFVAPFSNQKLYYDEPAYGNGTNPAAWRADYIAAADAGAAMTSYLGHGSFSLWGLDGLLRSSDVPFLAMNQKPTFLVNENCLAGGFHALGADALGEAFIKAQARGAAAVFAPAGLSFSTVTVPINNSLYGNMFGLTRERRFGNLMTDVRLALSFALPDMQAYTLLGDPAQRFILPGPRPPKSFAAQGGQDAKVTLSWTPSPDLGVKTRIYRATFPNGTYAPVTPAAGVSGTSFADTTAINGMLYFYRAVSLDPNGVFEGGVTNLNSTCDFFNPPASGPDCVWAKPLNPNPPAVPSGFQVSNPGLGDRLEVGWSATPEPDIQKYTVRYGTTSGGPYPSMKDFTAPTTGGEVANLVTGTAYYFIVTATNTSGLTSAPTGERSGIPLIFQGVDAPGFVSDLMVRRSVPSPSSIELTWTPPTQDIYGGPVTLASFSIYRGTTAGFVPSSSNRIAVIANPGAASYTDPGAYDAPQNYFYAVGAVDNRGFSSGLGRQLPLGISDLALQISGGNLNLTWMPVTTDVDGMPTFVAHYVVYADPQPVGRTRVDTLTPLAAFVGAPPFTTPIPAGTLVYYSVITVDVRGNRSPF